jgi:hypothetical protein
MIRPEQIHTLVRTLGGDPGYRSSVLTGAK